VCGAITGLVRLRFRDDVLLSTSLAMSEDVVAPRQW
jgi:hypothetical protein